MDVFGHYGQPISDTIGPESLRAPPWNGNGFGPQNKIGYTIPKLILDSEDDMQTTERTMFGCPLCTSYHKQFSALFLFPPRPDIRYSV